jgi:hypothetical protein
MKIDGKFIASSVIAGVLVWYLTARVLPSLVPATTETTS